MAEEAREGYSRVPGKVRRRATARDASYASRRPSRMKVLSIPIDEITISSNRQRQDFNHDSIAELAGSISQNGLISPVVVRRRSDGVFQLVAGERRLRALTYLWNFGESLRCGTQQFGENHVPAIDIGDLDDVDAFEVELEENIRRADLTWPERVQAVAQLATLRRMQAE